MHLFTAERKEAVKMACSQKIDEIILFELLKDGRKNLVEIAKECGVSKDIVRNHYLNLKKTGIIVGTTIQYNYQAFGYEGVATLMLNVESQHLKSTIEGLQKIDGLFCYRELNSPYNISIITTIRSLRHLSTVKEMIKNRYPIKVLKVNFWVDVRNIPENLIFKKAGSSTFPLSNRQLSGIPDQTDALMADQLTKDGQLSFKEIGRAIGVSTDTVTRRYKILVASGCLKVSAQINPLRLGFKAMNNLLVSVKSGENIENFINSISRVSNLSYMVKLNGDYDFHLCTFVRSFEDIFRNNQEISEISGVAQVHSGLRELPQAWPGPRQHISTF